MYISVKINSNKWFTLKYSRLFIYIVKLFTFSKYILFSQCKKKIP